MVAKEQCFHYMVKLLQNGFSLSFELKQDRFHNIRGDGPCTNWWKNNTVQFLGGKIATQLNVTLGKDHLHGLIKIIEVNPFGKGNTLRTAILSNPINEWMNWHRQSF